MWFVQSIRILAVSIRLVNMKVWRFCKPNSKHTLPKYKALLCISSNKHHWTLASFQLFGPFSLLSLSINRQLKLEQNFALTWWSFNVLRFAIPQLTPFLASIHPFNRIPTEQEPFPEQRSSFFPFKDSFCEHRYFFDGFQTANLTNCVQHQSPFTKTDLSQHF